MFTSARCPSNNCTMSTAALHKQASCSALRVPLHAWYVTRSTDARAVSSIARRRTLCGDRCGAVRILELADEPSTGIGRVGSLAGEPSAGIGVVPCESLSSPMNPLQGSGVSERSRCGAVRILELAGEPSAGIGCVGSLAGEPSAGIGVVPCESLSSPMNPLRGSGVSERSRCGAVRILELAGEPSAGIGRVGALSLWCRANP